MTDLSASNSASHPAPHPAPQTPQTPVELRESYLGMVRKKRIYGGVLLIFFVAIFASGWEIAEGRNAGGFWHGITSVFDFPAEVLAEAWEKRALWRAGSDLRAWLFTIMHNVYVNQLALVRREAGNSLATLDSPFFTSWPKLAL